MICSYKTEITMLTEKPPLWIQGVLNTLTDPVHLLLDLCENEAEPLLQQAKRRKIQESTSPLADDVAVAEGMFEPVASTLVAGQFEIHSQILDEPKAPPDLPPFDIVDETQAPGF